MVLVVIVCVNVFMLPTYIATRNLRNQAQDALKTKNLEPVDGKIKEIETRVKTINDVATKLSDGNARPRVMNVIRLIDSTLVSGIKVKSYEIAYTASSTVDMRVGGIASTRDTLVSFKKNIEANQGVARVELPVSDLAKSKDLTFVLRIISK